MTALNPQLRVRIQHQQGALALDLDFAVDQPWTILFGPSGSGKTTILRMVAGFMQPDSGCIAAGLEQSVVFDSDRGISVPPHLRPVRTAAQSARLFPHMSVRRNIAYGGGWLSKPVDEEQLVDELIKLFHLDGLEDKMPAALSGGESQRASVARAILSAVTRDRNLVLLDEPFTGLDGTIRDDLIATLPSWLRRWKTPVLSVTHDIAEAFQLGAEVIKIADGKVARQGPVDVVLAEERARLIAQLNAGVQSRA